MTNPSPPSMQVLTQWAVDPTSTLSGSSECYDFIRWGFGNSNEVVDANAVRGTRTHAMERKRAGKETPEGTVNCTPSSAWLRKWLPRILGAAESGGGPYTYATAETLPTFSMMKGGIAKDFQYNGCKVNKATFRGSAGEKMELELDMVATTEVIQNAGTLAGLSLAAPTDSFYMFQDLVITLGGTAYEVFETEITVDNQLIVDRFMNAQSRRQFPEQDRLVGVKIGLPYTADEVGIYTPRVITDIPIVATWTNGTHVLEITLGSCQFELKTPSAEAKEEIKLVLEGFAASKTVTGVTTPDIAATLTAP